MTLRITILLLFISSVSPGQTSSDLKRFIESFPMAALPQCVSYADQKMADSDSVSEAENSPEETAREVALIDTLLVKKYLLPQSNRIATDPTRPEEIYTEAIGHYLKADFNPRYRVIETSKYYGVMYDVISEANDDFKNSRTYFCTISKKGKFISRVLIASNLFYGWVGDQEEKSPFFMLSEGCVHKNMTITFRGWNEHKQRNYSITPDGKIQQNTSTAITD